MNANEQLSAQCRGLGQATRDGIAWLAAHGGEHDVSSTIKELKRTVVAAGKLERAALRKMCVGVFGPSQAGKSYLISALARRGQQRLIAKFGALESDFIADINPEGGKESTGVVTRFSITQGATPPDGHPVELNLLSEIDLLKILVNSYVHDIRHDKEDEQQHDATRILERMEQLGARAGAPDPSLDADQIVDLEEYCSERLIGNPRMKVLRRIGFWSRLGELAPRLPVEERIQMVALLWDGLDVYTALYRRLRRALAALDFPATAYCALDGLLTPGDGGWGRRGDSIVNVDTLAGLSDPATPGDAVSVATAARTAKMDRCELTAVTAELVIRMRDKAYDFFDHTDLLDFPGARSRKAHEVEHVREPGIAEELFLRGKVAYLFERYCAEQELTSMLLCMGPENMEVVSLPSLVFEWIRTAQGERPSDRAEQPNALLLVMTKFDTAFAQAAGKSAGGASRWTSRLQTSLLKPFGSHPAWPLEWAPGRPFNNSYWVRNPNFRQDALFDYAGGESLEEVGLRADKQDFVRELRAGFLETEEVRQHFSDPAEAWDAALALNDGGISLIVRKLEPLCNPSLKRNQVSARMQRLREQVRLRLQPFFFSGDLAAEQSKQDAMVQGMAERLSLAISQQRFGEFLASLHVSEMDAYDVFVSSERRAARTAGGGADRAAILGSVFRRPGAAAPPPPANDAADGFATELQNFWTERLQSFAQSPAWLAYFDLESADVVSLAQELATGLRRTGTAQRIALAVRRAQQFKDIDRDALIWKQVMPASLQLNQFVDWLDCGGPAHPKGTEIDVDGESRTVFPPSPPVGRFPALPDEAQPFDVAFAVDWLIAFRKLVRDNVAYRAGAEIDLASNARLGAVLDQLGGPALAGEGANVYA